MAARDNVLFHANVASGTASGTVVPFSMIYGIENVRQGYGTPILKSARAFYNGGGSNFTNAGIPIEIKNSNWIDSAGLVAENFAAATVLNKDNVSYMRGRDKQLAPNTAWTIAATLPFATNAGLDMYVLLEIEYSDVAGINAEKASGSPVMKKCANASVTISSNTPGSIGSFDNLLQGVTYVLSEVSIKGNLTTPMFLVVEGFSNQRGLTRILPMKATGLADQIEGSVYLTKQTYSLSLIPCVALSAAAVEVQLEMIASSN